MKYLLFILYFTTTFLVSGQSPLQKVLNDIHSKPFFKHASLGVCVRDVTDGQLIATLSKDKMMNPASTLKLITTLTAKSTLGTTFRFKTTLSHDGVLKDDGTLHGNIYIQGSGDPTLGAGRIPGNANMKEWENYVVNEIKASGIHCIEGDIVALVNNQTSAPLGDSWQWHDIGNYYASGSWSLNINENLYSIYYNRNMNLGETAKLSYIEPYIPNLKISTFVSVDSQHTEDKAYIFGTPYNYQRDVQGTIPQGKSLFRIKGAIPDPPLFLAYRLFTALGQHHIDGSHYRTQLDTFSDFNKIHTYVSPPLAEIIRYTNDQSINIYADALLNSIGQSSFVKKNAEILKLILQKDGLDVTAIHIEDGSGLSARNLVSPDFMTSFLVKQMTTMTASDIPNLMPTVGERGTVKNLLAQSPAKGKMWAKSGSMDKTLAYAGYCRTASGKLVAFSVMLNGSVARTMKENKIELEEILDAIYRFS